MVALMKQVFPRLASPDPYCRRDGVSELGGSRPGDCGVVEGGNIRMGPSCDKSAFIGSSSSSTVFAPP